MQIEKVPKHIGIIVDGNRRFAKRLMMKPWKGHEWGAKKFEQLLEWCKEYKVKELTLYTFSIENFKLYKGFHKKICSTDPFCLKFLDKVSQWKLLHDKTDIFIVFFYRNNFKPCPFQNFTQFFFVIKVIISLQFLRIFFPRNRRIFGMIHKFDVIFAPDNYQCFFAPFKGP